MDGGLLPQARASTSRTSCAPVANGRRSRSSIPFQLEGGLAASFSVCAPRGASPPFHCTTPLANGQYQLTQFENPRRAGRGACRGPALALQGHGRLPVDGASIAAIDIPLEGAGAGRQAMVYAVAAGQPAVASVMGAFGEGKVPLAAIDIPELAQRNVAALFEEPNRGLAFLHLDESGGLLTITFRGELYAVRRIEVSANSWPTPMRIAGSNCSSA